MSSTLSFYFPVSPNQLEWLQFLTPDSRILLNELVQFLNKHKIWAQTELPENFVQQAWSIYKKTSTDLNYVNNKSIALSCLPPIVSNINNHPAEYDMDVYTIRPSQQQFYPITLFISKQFGPKDSHNIHMLQRRILTVMAMPCLTKNYLSSRTIDTAPEIYIIATTATKIMPNGPITEHNPFKEIHINSAETSKKKQTVVIIRLEEMAKVLVHEFLHLIYFDHGTTVSNDQLEKFCAFHGDFLLSEAVVEAMTCILNTIFIAADYWQARQRNEVKILNQMWNLERMFGIFQAAKILVACGFNNLNEFFEPAKTTKRIFQETHTAEYHILKAILLQNPTKLIHILSEKNSQAYDDKQILELIIENKASLEPLMNQFIRAIETDKLPDKLAQTLRMTILDQ